MKLPPFNHAEMEWDTWRAFHLTHHSYNKFVQFDTGEFVVCAREWRPDARQVFKELHLQVVATDDEDCPKLYTPGMATVVGAKPIPKSHLNHGGQQILLLDFDHKRAVSIGSRLDNVNAPTIPERFMSKHSPRDIAAYYAGSDSVPIGTPITRHYPHPLTYDQRAHIKEIENAAKVWLEMQPNADAIKKEARGVIAPRVSEFVDVSFGVLTTEHRKAIALRGFNMIAREKHDWLTFNTEGETDGKAEAE